MKVLRKAASEYPTLSISEPMRRNKPGSGLAGLDAGYEDQRLHAFADGT